MVQLVEISPSPPLLKLFKLKVVLKGLHNVHHGNAEAVLTFTVLGGSTETTRNPMRVFFPEKSSSTLPKSPPNGRKT